jgi:AraC-like DNA-binding protein
MLQKPGKSDRVYTQTKLAAIIDTVVAGGVSPAQALAGAGVSAAELLSPDTRVSVQQVLIACGDAIRLSRHSSLAFRAGASMHGRVRALLLQDLGRRPSLTAVAGRLQISERTLRRRLAQQGVSFRSLLDELRAQLAVRYLRETSMKNDDIADATGFRDPATFRHAFRRWTGRPPSVFRRAPPLA